VSLDRRGIERLASFTADSRVGARVPVSGGWEVTRGRNDLVLATMTSKATTQLFPLSDGTRVGGWTFRADPAGATALQRDAWSAWLPADTALIVRPWRAGDVMTLENGGVSRKVKHLLSTAGVTGHERTGWPVVMSGNDIVWIPGVRRGASATARPGRPGLAFVCDYDNR
jgi:tRNA(Ile)-lysidine synthetase-like protein